ncbi:MAG: FAD-binding oxidoreductase [Pseudomonadota bacterium]|nr:FAD-binding oxidoreductase [Pseudomonadota bacterium]
MSSFEPTPLDRRRLLRGSGALGGLSLVGLGGCATASRPAPSLAGQIVGQPAHEVVPPLAPVRASNDRIFDITVCLRPFRAAGPRLDTETIGEALVVHNYGHGGSGWSLSWGSSTIAVRKAMAGSPRAVAVLGCGALGLTSATLAQRAGAEVTLYARELLPDTRSSRATGTWTPDSRIALASAAPPGFAALWEEMARTSFKIYRQYLGLPGHPVEWTDRYIVSDISPQEMRTRHRQEGLARGALDFAQYGERIADLRPPFRMLPAASTPFDYPYVLRSEAMMFNLADYGHTLLNDFLAAGGKIERREFHAPADLALLKEKVVINCPGYGARALWKHESIVPVRGQIAWLIPQPEVDYGVIYKDVAVLPRRDGIVVQAIEGGDMKGYGDANETVDRAEAERAVATIAELYSRFRAPSGA